MARKAPNPCFQLMDNDHQGVFSMQSLRFPRLLSGMGDGTVIEWDCQTGDSSVVIDFSEKTFPIIGLKYFRETLYVQAKNGQVKIYKPDTGDYFCFEERYSNYLGFSKIKLSLQCGGLLGCPENNHLDLMPWNNITRDYVRRLKTPDNAGCIMDFEFVNSFYVLIAYESGQMSLWDMRTSKIISSICGQDTPMVISYDWETQVAFEGNHTNTIHTFTLGSPELTLKPHKDIIITNPGVSCIQIRPDKKLVSVASWDKRIRLFSLKKLRPLAVLEGHYKTIQDIMFVENFYPSGKKKMIMLTGCLEGKILFWDIYN